MIALVNENGQPRKIFGTRFWGFDPKVTPFCGFLHRGTRDSLINKSSPGDLILVLGTLTQNTDPEDQGRLLGLIEFARTAFFADELMDPSRVLDDRLFDEHGEFRWPYAVPAIRAWRFLHKPEIRQVIGRQLNMAAITGVDQLSWDETSEVLKQQFAEITLSEGTAAKAAKRQLTVRLDKSASGQPGPPPSEWSSITSREDGPTATYLMQFGKSDVFKLGISKNPGARLEALNFSVPYELLGARWELQLEHKFEGAMAAYEMEQALLKHLSPYTQGNERIRCSKDIILKAWINFVSGKL